MTLTGQISQVIISGLNMGCVYAILGLTIAVVYNVSKIFDVSQGEYVMLGAMLMCLFESSKLPLWLCIVISIAVPIFCGLIIWRVLFHSPSQKYPPLTLIMMTFGVAMLIEGLSYLFLGTDTKISNNYINIKPIRVMGGILTGQSILLYAVLIIMLLCLHILFSKTMIGKSLRACHERPLAARLMGINPRNMMYFSFILAVSLGAIGGIIMVPLTAATYNMGLFLVIKGFLAALVGGISRFSGVVIGGLALGLSESIIAGFVSSSYASIIALSIFVVALLFRPAGLMISKYISY